jgi:3-dehydroquinate dehydratase/shikimate dehydrogenase
MTLLCETVAGRSMAELIRGRDASTADLVELRLDGIRDLDVGRTLVGRQLPVIVTCRAPWEGGRFDGSEDERRRILAAALQLGAEYIDVEWRAGFGDLIASTGGRRIVVSNHDFDGVPPDLAERARAMRATGAELIKMAIMAKNLSDSLPLIDIAVDGPAVVIAMGDAGTPSRVLARRFHSRWTYAGDGVAPGQISVARMLREFRFRQIGSDTAIYGVAGNPVMHSLSPVMHNSAFASERVDAVFVPLQAESFGDFAAFADRIDVAGASVTIPFKRDALAAAESADAVSQRIGAANTLRRNGRSWDATNTDVAGFLAPLNDVSGKRASVLGAGGAARAVAVALASVGARVTVHARRPDQAREVASLVDGDIGEWPPRPSSWDVLVNCTPIGSVVCPDASPLPGGPFDGELVYDLIYKPAETRLMREARLAGCRTIGGLPMLIAQAERQFEWWTGRRPRPGVMRDAAAAAGYAASEDAAYGRRAEL